MGRDSKGGGDNCKGHSRVDSENKRRTDIKAERDKDEQREIQTCRASREVQCAGFLNLLLLITGRFDGATQLPWSLWVREGKLNSA